MKASLLKITIFLTIPFLIGEYYMARREPTHRWYGRKERMPAAMLKRMYFLGTSYVEGGIIADQVAKTLREEFQMETEVINIGLGGSTLGIHYIALQEKLKHDPNALRGANVFIESLFGQPNILTWKHEWPNSVASCGPYIRPQDIPRLLHSSSPADVKFQLAASALFKSTLLVPEFQQKANRNGENLVNVGFLGIRSLLYPNRPVMKEDTEISSSGSIRTDNAGIRNTRAFVLAKGPALEKEAQARKPVKNWEETILYDLVQLIREAGGTPALFETVSSSYVRKSYFYPTPQEDDKNFAEVRKRWRIPLYRVPLKYTDDDFPDLSHLSKDRAVEYSMLVAREIGNAKLP